MRVFSPGVALALLSGACQCARVPDLVFPCETQSDCLRAEMICVGGYCVAPADAGESDAGRDGGPVDGGEPDSGTADGGTTDGGTPDGGTPDGGVTPDAGPWPWCNDWACVQSDDGGVTAQASDFLFATLTVDGGPLGWYGAVLAPTGRVIGIPHTARQVLEVDPDAGSMRFGPPLQLQPGDVGKRMWAGAVLMPDDFIYAPPYDGDRFLQIDPYTLIGLPFGPAVPHSEMTSGVIDAFGLIWAVPSIADGGGVIARFDPRTLRLDTWGRDAGLASFGGWHGLVRLPDDRLLAMPKEPGLAGAPLLIDPRDAGFTLLVFTNGADAGFGLQHPTLRADGIVFAESSSAPLALELDPRALTSPRWVPLASTPGTFASHRDGRMYLAADLDGVFGGLEPDGGQFVIGTFPAPRYGYLGLVSTPRGLVGIPCAASSVFVYRPVTAETRSVSTLLSPYFNHY